MCCARAWHTDERYECFDLACIDAIPMITATSTYATLLSGGETKARASALPFEAGSFDVAVSNLVFHEVSDTNDKLEVIKEALRVVRKGGAFAFQDLFRKRVYGDIEELLEAVRCWGIERVEFLDTAHSGIVPKALRLPLMLGTIGIL